MAGQRPDFLRATPKFQIRSQKPVAATGRQPTRTRLPRTRRVRPLLPNRFRQRLSTAQHFRITTIPKTGYNRDRFPLGTLKAFSIITHSLRYRATTHRKSRRPHFHPSLLNYPPTILRLPRRKRPRTLFLHPPRNSYNPTHTSPRGPRMHSLCPYLAPTNRTREATQTRINGIPSPHRS